MLGSRTRGGDRVEAVPRLVSPERASPGRTGRFDSARQKQPLPTRRHRPRPTRVASRPTPRTQPGALSVREGRESPAKISGPASTPSHGRFMMACVDTGPISDAWVSELDALKQRLAAMGIPDESPAGGRM